MCNRLMNYIVCCHVDKELTQVVPESVFDVFIQAGSALTKKHICKINDLDDCDDSISDRNSRYSEATAMYWIWKHLKTPYVGIMHYRRRFQLSDEQYEKHMDNGVDIITSKIHELETSIENEYRSAHYSCDWDLFLEIIKKLDPDNYDFYNEILNDSKMHICNIGIYRAEIYKEFCDWAFPICDEFYRRSPEKTDVYQHRDVGFIMERLTHLFVSKKKREGLKIVEAELIDLRSEEWEPDNECAFDDTDSVFEACNRLYKANQIIKCNNVLGIALRRGVSKDERLSTLSEVLITSVKERMEIPRSMHEYLPIEYRCDLEILIDIWKGFKSIVKLHSEMNTDFTLEKLTEYIRLTGFSKIALREAYAYCDK